MTAPDVRCRAGADGRGEVGDQLTCAGVHPHNSSAGRPLPSIRRPWERSHVKIDTLVTRRWPWPSQGTRARLLAPIGTWAGPRHELFPQQMRGRSLTPHFARTAATHGAPRWRLHARTRHASQSPRTRQPQGSVWATRLTAPPTAPPWCLWGHGSAPRDRPVFQPGRPTAPRWRWAQKSAPLPLIPPCGAGPAPRLLRCRPSALHGSLGSRGARGAHGGASATPPTGGGCATRPGQLRRRCRRLCTTFPVRTGGGLGGWGGAFKGAPARRAADSAKSARFWERSTSSPVLQVATGSEAGGPRGDSVRAPPRSACVVDRRLPCLPHALSHPPRIHSEERVGSAVRLSAAPP